MTAFHVSLIALAGLLASAGGGVSFAAPSGAPTHVAQTSQPPAPVQLGPRRLLSPNEGAERPAPDTRGSETQTAPLAPMSPSGESGPVQVQTLQAVDADSVGVIDDAEGGLGADMWAGSDRAFISRVIGLLPGEVQSPLRRGLLRRLLLTRAAAPLGNTAGPSLLSLRINVLYAMGDLRSAMALIASAPIGPVDEALLRTEVESRFFLQDTAGACGQVRGAARDFTDIYWQQATAYCLALAGKTAEAALMSDILAERSASVHPAFFAAMDRLSGATPPTVESLENPSALYLSMMRAASLLLPADVAAKAPPAAQNAVALSPNATLELRLTAAENAAVAGVLPGETLNEIYNAMTFDADTLDAPLTKAEGVWGIKGRALLMRAAISQTVPAARAEVLQQAFKLARKNGDLRVTAIAARPVLQSMEPAEDLAWFAGTAGRALILAGEFEAARRWIEMGLKQASKEASENTGPGALWPLAILIGAADADGVTPEALQAWWNKLVKDGTPDAATAGSARAFFGLLDALEIPVPTSLWAPIFNVTTPDAVQGVAPATTLDVRIALGRAVEAERRGEVVALSLAVLGNDGPGGPNLVAVDMAVRALRKAGLAVEAQRIALEAAVAAGL